MEVDCNMNKLRTFLASNDDELPWEQLVSPTPNVKRIRNQLLAE